MSSSSKVSKGRPPCDRFIALCLQADAPPDLTAFLGQFPDCTLREKFDVIAVDQYWRWMLGTAVPAETYLERFPEIAADKRLKLELLVCELCSRHEAGEGPDPAQLAARFPKVGKALLKFVADQDQVRRYWRHSAVGKAARRRSETTTIAAMDSQLITNLSSLTAAKQPSSAESPPETFGRYRIVEKLGEGSMGTVHLAEDPQLNRRVALKFPKFAHGDRDKAVARFYREARIAAGLRNANICPVYDVGEVDGVHFISMPYIEGRLLSEVVADGNRLKVREAVLLVRTLAMALHEAHLQGIVHRDLKPSNIIVDDRGQPVIMDFGLARETYEPGAERLTADHTIVGSPAYMSPELVESEGAVGPQSDIFSLGVLMYELLTGRLPFRGSFAKVAMQIVSREPERPTKIRPDLDTSIERVCLRMLAKQPDKRYSSMSKVAIELTKYLRRPDVAGSQSSATIQTMSKAKSSATMKAARPPAGESPSTAKPKARKQPPRRQQAGPAPENEPRKELEEWLNSDGDLFRNVDISELLDD